MTGARALRPDRGGAVRALLAAASGPGHLRAELERATRPALALARTIASPRIPAARFPESLLTGDLGVLAGDRLRARLDAVSGPAAHSSVAADRARPALADSRLPERRGHADANEAGMPARAAAGPRERAALSPGRVRVPPPPHESVAKAHARDRGASLPQRTARKRGDALTAAPPLERSTFAVAFAPGHPDARPRASQRRGGASGRSLSAALREYWELTAGVPGESRARSVTDGARTAARDRAHPAAREETPATEAARSRDPLPAGGGDDVAQWARAHEVLKTPDQRGRSAREWVAAPSGNGTGTSPAMLRSGSRVLPPSDVPDDLPERLAELLREQALAHGVDLT